MNTPTTPRPGRPATLADLRDGALITLDLSTSVNRLGPPPAAVAALHTFLARDTHRLVPPPSEAAHPPFRAHRRYLQAFADRLGVRETDMLAAGGIDELVTILTRVLSLSNVAVITPEHPRITNRFPCADVAGPNPGVRDTPELRWRRLRMAMRTHDYVILSNPSNPLGHHIPREQVLQACKDDPLCVLIVNEEHLELQGPGLSLAGALPTNLVVLQSTGPIYGLAGTRAGMLWTRHARLRRMVMDQLAGSPLSLLDITAATAALKDSTWLPGVLPQLTADAHRLQLLLTDHFGQAVTPAEVPYRFVHLTDPQLVLAQLQTHGVTARLFSATSRGGAGGLRFTAPSTDAEFDQLSTALRAVQPPPGTPA